MSFGGRTGPGIWRPPDRAVVSATCELVLQVLEGTVERAMDEEIGLKSHGVRPGLGDLHRNMAGWRKYTPARHMVVYLGCSHFRRSSARRG